MSQPYDEAEYIKLLKALWIQSYIGYSITVLLPIYEFVITFDQEIATVWSRGKKLSLASILLVSTRWCMFILALINVFPVSPESCEPETIVTRVLLFAGFAQVALFSALRVSAIWEKSRLLFFVILIPGLTPIFTTAHYVYRTDGGVCDVLTNGMSDRVNHILILVTRIPVITADALVLVLTWMKTFRQVVEARKNGITMSVSMCLIRDGTLYFLVLFVLNLVELLTNNTAGGAAIGNFVIIIPPILVSRFIFNLRQLNPQDGTPAAGHFSNFSAPNFRVTETVFANFAEPLDHGGADTDVGRSRHTDGEVEGDVGLREG